MGLIAPARSFCTDRNAGFAERVLAWHQETSKSLTVRADSIEVKADQKVFYSIARGPAPAERARRVRAAKTAERRRSFRRPLGTAAVIARLAGSEELNRLDVLVMDVSEKGVGLRCPIGLGRGGIYRLRIGTTRGAAATKSAPGTRFPRSLVVEASCFICLIRVTRCQKRDDGTFDVGARFQATPSGWSG